MKKDKIKVAVVDNSIDSSIYDPVKHWGAYLDVPWESFKATENNFPDLIRGYTHIVLTGSEASILNREDWSYQEIEVIQKAVKRGLSILASCYGHQLLAIALAGPSRVRRCPYPEIGWVPIQINRKNDLLQGIDQIYSFSLHFDEVVSLGDEFYIFASTDKCSIQGFQWKNKPVWGIQMHPEISVLEGKKLLRKLISMNYKTRLFFERALNSAPHDSGHIRQIVNSFLFS